ncbi:MAG: hypothetical protein CMJ78_25000 [Planctomycetaceae bacterium]|nr:hypothetical protein [Planctomycetaceae bacterium]
MQAFWIILAIVALLAVIEWFVQRKTISIIRPIFETSPTFNVESFDADPTAESVRFRTSDGLELAGAIHRHKDLEPKGLVLFLHEFGSTHRSAMSYCEALWNAGFDIFAFDIRNHGDSESLANYKPLHWLTHYEVADALAAVDYIQSRDDLKNLPLGVFGISKGGGAALAIAAQRPEISAVACEGTFCTFLMMMHYTRRWINVYLPEWISSILPDWHLKLSLKLTARSSEKIRSCQYYDLEAQLHRLSDRPVYVISGKRDTYVPPELAMKMASLMGKGEEDVWVVRKAKHNMARKVAQEEYDERLVNFFFQPLRPPVSATRAADLSLV